MVDASSAPPPASRLFHGDTKTGIGASSHQIGRTGCAAKLMHLCASAGAKEVLKDFPGAGFVYDPPAGRLPLGEGCSRAPTATDDTV